MYALRRASEAELLFGQPGFVLLKTSIIQTGLPESFLPDPRPTVVQQSAGEDPSRANMGNILAEDPPTLGDNGPQCIKAEEQTQVEFEVHSETEAEELSILEPEDG